MYSVNSRYVSNVSIIFDCSMLFYYQSWMFYNHFIIILYHFLVLTYWHSAKCYLLFFHVFYITVNQYQTKSKCHETLQRIFMGQKKHNGPWLCLGVPWGGRNPPGRARRPRRALVGCAHLGCPPDRLFALQIPQKSTNPRGVRRVQNTRSNLDTISDGVHHLHGCLSDDAWVVLCRPSGP